MYTEHPLSPPQIEGDSCVLFRILGGKAALQPLLIGQRLWGCIITCAVGC